MVVRRHWLFELTIAFKGFLVAIVPLLLWLAFRAWLDAWQMLVLLVVFLYMQFILLWAFKNWLDFYLDVIVVTSNKLIDIDQEGFFNRRISETSLARVQDAAGKLHGFIGTLLKFGTVDIQTAGNESKFTLDRVGHPMETAAAIQHIQAEYLAQSGNMPGGHDELMNEV